MTDYRLYFHDEKGHFMRAQNIERDSDAEAMSEAKAIDHAHCIEIWQGKRHVGIVRPEAGEDKA